MGGKRILVIDDEPQMVEILKVRLEASGYGVISSYDGLDAVEKARREKPDLILLDIMLPRMDGYRVCRTLKFDERYKDIPIIMFTARAHEKDKETAEEVGADAYMIKPFEPRMLLDKIKELLGE